MATRTWEFQDDQLRKYVVTFDHGRWSRWQTVTANGVVASRVQRGLDATGVHRFTFDGHSGELGVRMRGLGYDYDLDVDGQRVEPRGTRLTAGGAMPTTAPLSSAPTTHFPSAVTWLYWIAGATLVNAALYHGGSGVAFPVGALFGFFLEGFANALGLPLGWLGHVLVAGLFFWIARRVRAGSSRALKIGIVLYSLDSVLDTLIEFDAILVALRVLAVWSLVRALRTAPRIASSPPVATTS